MTDHTPDKNKTEGMSRRQFMKNSGLVAGGVVGGSLLGGLFTNKFQNKTETVTKGDKTTADLTDARMFFSRKEDFDILSAATERIFPKDDNGPGAIELGVPYFIDKQLAGPWGMNAKEYMKGPFPQNATVQDNKIDQDNQGPNTETQIPVPSTRYQARLNRSEIFTQGLRKIETVAQDKFETKFTDITGEQQDEVLKMFEDNQVAMNGVSAQAFFNLLIATTLEGAYADPVYGGNKDMLGWKMKEFPGPRLGYLGQIEDEEFIIMEPESLKDYQVSS